MSVKDGMDGAVDLEEIVGDWVEQGLHLGCAMVGAALGGAAGSAVYGPLGMVGGIVLGFLVGYETGERITGEQQGKGDGHFLGLGCWRWTGAVDKVLRNLLQVDVDRPDGR
jgi:hypothetical protein